MPKLMTPMTLILFGAIIVAIGTYWQSTASSAKSDRIIAIQNDLIVKSEKLVDAQNELLKYTTGGNSFGEVQLLKISDGQGGYHYTLYFKKLGDYPLYNVIISSLDRSLMGKERLRKQNNEATLDDLKNYSNFNLGDISNVDGGQTFSSLLALKEEIIYDYLFTINTRNRAFYQEFKFVENKNTLLTATKITSRTSDGKTEVLIDRADETFPGSKEGKIDWE